MENFFSQYRDPATITKGRFARVGQSALNWWQAKTPEKISKRAIIAAIEEVGLDSVVTALDNLIPVGEFAADFVPVLGSVIKLAKIAYSMSSDRDTRHNYLTPYVWSLVDDYKPAPAPHDSKGNFNFDDKGFGNAMAACHVLMDTNQMILKDGKYEKAKTAFDAFIKKIRLYNRTDISQVDLNDMFSEAMKDGGALFEYGRRLIHFNNYLQAKQFYGFHLMGHTNQGGYTEQIAYGSGLSEVNKIRKHLSRVSDYFKKIKVISSP